MRPIWFVALLFVLAFSTAAMGSQPVGEVIGWGYFRLVADSAFQDARTIGAGTHHAFSIDHEGSIAGWGWNRGGQCEAPEPNEGYLTVAGGAYISIALRNDGSIEVFGENETHVLHHNDARE